MNAFADFVPPVSDPLKRLATIVSDLQKAAASESEEEGSMRACEPASFRVIRLCLSISQVHIMKPLNGGLAGKTVPIISVAGYMNTSEVQSTHIKHDSQSVNDGRFPRSYQNAHLSSVQ